MYYQEVSLSCEFSPFITFQMVIFLVVRLRLPPLSLSINSIRYTDTWIDQYDMYIRFYFYS